MTIDVVPAFTDNYIWLIIDEAAKVFDCVDPGDAKPVLEFAKQKHLKLRTILLTHHHADHIGGVHELVKDFPDCKVYAPNDARIPHKDIIVKENDIVSVGNYHFKVLSNPGHTSSHISYFEPKEGWLFCGDTLFSAGCGRVFDGTMEQLHQSLQMFKQLPAPTKVFCAHEYTLQNLRFAETVEPKNSEITKHIKQLRQQSQPCSLPSSIALECLINPFFRTEIPAVQDFALKHGAVHSDSLSVFRVLREEKNVFQ